MMGVCVGVDAGVLESVHSLNVISISSSISCFQIKLKSNTMVIIVQVLPMYYCLSNLKLHVHYSSTERNGSSSQQLDRSCLLQYTEIERYKSVFLELPDLNHDGTINLRPLERTFWINFKVNIPLKIKDFTKHISKVKCILAVSLQA